MKFITPASNTNKQIPPKINICSFFIRFYLLNTWILNLYGFTQRRISFAPLCIHFILIFHMVSSYTAFAILYATNRRIPISKTTK